MNSPPDKWEQSGNNFKNKRVKYLNNQALNSFYRTRERAVLERVSC